MRGPAGTEFEGGIYHFRIQLPSEYPFRPPSIMLLTPNGRFELNTKICISFTNYHEELWQPAWGVRTAIIALQGFFPLKGETAVGVGAVEYPTLERKRLAKLSRDWRCPRCEKANVELLPDAVTCVQTIGSSEHAQDTSKGEDVKHSSPVISIGPGEITPASPPTFSSHVSQTTPSAESQVNISPASNPLSQPSVQRQPGPRLVQSRSARPPLVLDGAIAVCLTMLVAILWKKIF
ncbi:ubiquitin-conjugating enzyme/RWD-like protein [Gautieria morchelliformis]|nr:ubiquitin-conjugating enzyme/RWD-like protein [Gautieria morchelliformis]